MRMISRTENNKFQKRGKEGDEDQIGPQSPDKLIEPDSFGGLPSEGTGRPRGIARSPYDWQPD
eukprot:4431843-Heterocapsa_arctica.AAC.1